MVFTYQLPLYFHGLWLFFTLELLLYFFEIASIIDLPRLVLTHTKDR